jgi:predicted HicB family RNase H-like nuclease
MGKIYTKAQAKATEKYTSRFSNLNLRISPELKDEITIHCKSHDCSIASFARRAFKNQIALDNKETTQ